jgi:tRNA threonylcarbamoyladenosine biosynthesis protein TsaE
MKLQCKINSEEQMQALAQRMAACLLPILAERSGCILWLEGDLGAGKTFFTRALLQAWGVTGMVCSPTYTLLNQYTCAVGLVVHMDLYRLRDPEELLCLGIDDLSDAPLWVVEWPDRGAGFMPEADLMLHLAYEGEGRLATLHTTNSSLKPHLKMVFT